MDAEEFMMHGFDSDVSEDDDEAEEAGKVSATEVSQDKSQQDKKYSVKTEILCKDVFSYLSTNTFEPVGWGGGWDWIFLEERNS